MSTFSEAEQKWIEALRSQEYNQGHLLDGLDDDATRHLVSQIEQADKTYPGGLLNYICRARELLKASRDGLNPYEGYVAEKPKTVIVDVGSDEFFELEEVGLKNLSHVAFVLVAGGLGERLGYGDIKVSLPTETVTNSSYLEFYCQSILAIESACRVKQSGDCSSDFHLPFVIMTSGDTHARTLAYLEDNKYFGLKPAQVHLLMQEKVPALIDNEARIGKHHETGELEMKPHGHGDVHTLLQQSGLAKQWVMAGTVKWVFFFQDTNALIFRALASLLGASVQHDLVMNSLVVPRMPGDAIGAVCLLKNAATRSVFTVNVEYNQLENLLQSTGGDVAGEGSKYSAFPGNANIILMSLEPYSQILDNTGGAVPEFINPKYADATKTAFKSSARVECMMQEFARLFREDQNVGCTMYEKWFCFSPVKNSNVDGQSKLQKGLHPECCLSGEFDMYANAVKCFKIAGERAGCKVDIGESIPMTVTKMTMDLSAKLIIKPTWAIFISQMVKRLEKSKSVTISQRSSLVLEGEVCFSNLSLDGGLYLKGISCSLFTENLKISNSGHSIYESSDASGFEDLKHAVRGYCFREGSDIAKICC